MIQSVILKNFKSFRAENVLPLSPLTVLIGANASGKSNAIEAMQLLSWLASGRRLGDLLHSISEQELSIRGTLSDFAHAEGNLSLGCTVRDEQDEELDFLNELSFRIELGVGEEGLKILGERLSSLLPIISKFPLYEVVEPASAYGNEIQVAYNNFSRGGKKPRIACIDQQAVFTQLATPARFAAEHRQSQQVIPAAASRLRQALESILVLDPSPPRMRGYSFLQEKSLRGDGAALSAVLHRLVEEGQKDEILAFIRSLPEQDIRDVSFLSTPRNEVMVQLHETFGGKRVPREAALLSDGTLRVLAVAAALLSVPEGSTVVIEEIDNGVHPSRAELLLSNIHKAARERGLKVLLTTHNPALLDAIPLESIPNAVACYRDPEEGDSRLVRLGDLRAYPELVAQGPIGRLVTKGILDRTLKAPDLDEEERVERNLRWLKVVGAN